MTNTVFYMKLGKHSKKINWDALEDGNPGMGGTQYLFLMVVHYLRAQGESVVLLSDIDVPKHGIYSVEDEDAVVNYCCANKVSNMVLNAYGSSWALENEVLHEHGVRLFFWAHNFLSYSLKKEIVKARNVPRIICVSQKQHEKLIKNGLEGISSYVNNFISSDFLSNAIPSTLQSKKVAYIGAIFPNKGCHNLLRIWKHILDQEADAELLIIGGSSVYGSTISCGKLGITDKAYELVLTHLLKKVSKKESVKFVGGKSWSEIPQLISDARVGIVNPSYFKFDETFCMSAVEFEAYGIPVVSRYRNDGLCNTINHGSSGFLYSDDKDIAAAVVNLLRDYHLCSEMAMNSREHAKSFTEERSIAKWKELLNVPKPTDKPIRLRYCLDDYEQLKEKWKMNIYKIFRRLI